MLLLLVMSDGLCQLIGAGLELLEVVRHFAEGIEGQLCHGLFIVICRARMGRRVVGWLVKVIQEVVKFLVWVVDRGLSV